jgi:hypothetical protein
MRSGGSRKDGPDKAPVRDRPATGECGSPEGRVGLESDRVVDHLEQFQSVTELPMATAFVAWNPVTVDRSRVSLVPGIPGAKVIASPWNPPASMTESFSGGKRLRYDSYGAYAQHLNDFTAFMADNGVHLYGISVQNEPDYAQDWTAWTSSEIVRFLHENAGTIGTKVIAPESFQYRKNMSDPILNDATALANVDIIGSHLYGTLPAVPAEGRRQRAVDDRGLPPQQQRLGRSVAAGARRGRARVIGCWTEMAPAHCSTGGLRPPVRPTEPGRRHHEPSTTTGRTRRPATVTTSPERSCAPLRSST